MALAISGRAMAQFIVQPSLGVQTIWFNGDYPVSQPISPGVDRTLPLGGGIMGNNPGGRLQIELIPDPTSMFRVPVSIEAYRLDGRTTFSASGPTETRKKRWLFTHEATLISAGAGLTASFFNESAQLRKTPTLYVSAEAKINYISPTDLVSRIYYVDTDEDVIPNVTVHPDSVGETRIGLALRLGTQVDFFDPFLLDFNVGYGVLNLIGKVTDPTKQRNILVVESQRRDPEITVGYISFGLSLVWHL